MRVQGHISTLALAGVHRVSSGGSSRDRFLHVEVLTWRGLVTYYVLFFIHLESRRVCWARITLLYRPKWGTRDSFEQMRAVFFFVRD